MQAKRFEALDGWRGIAALAVAFYHVPIAHPLRDFAGWKNWELFVDLFFVLSGFVMMHAWGARLTGFETAKEFMTRRFWRLWPLHFSMLLMLLALELAKAGATSVIALPLDGAPFSDNRSWATLLSNIAMTQALNLHGTTSWNGAAWSISVEFWTYLVFAAVLLGVKRHRALAFLLVSAGALALLAVHSKNYLFATHDFGFLRALYGFFLGAAVHRLVTAERVTLHGGTRIEIAAIIAMAGFLVLTGMNATSYFAPLIFAGLILVFSQHAGFASRILESGPVQALGRWSYSIYLVHAVLFYIIGLALQVGIKVAKLPLIVTGVGGERLFSTGIFALDAAVIVGMLALSVFLSAFTYRLIEKPFMAPSASARLPAKDRGAALA